MNINFILGYTTEITNSLKTKLARPQGDPRIKIQIAQGYLLKGHFPGMKGIRMAQEISTR